jgi:Fic family protein
MAILYSLPDRWVKFDPAQIIDELSSAKAAVILLASIPFQRSWAEELEKIELKREVAGTSRIEGAEFTERELDEALAAETGETLMTRSQKQARAALYTYHWIAKLPPDRPIDASLVLETHRRIVTGCDDDHCDPGKFRGSGNNVSFGLPRHRGVEGGKDCERAFGALCEALGGEFRRHDALIQAFALHYHLGAMHLFMDGNGRTARAVEALLLRRARLKDAMFVAMSNYYYAEKDGYLAALAKCRAANHDLTAFLKFGLHGLAQQCERLIGEVKRQLSKSLFRDVMSQMYGRLQSTKKRALADRQVAILRFLLERDSEIGLNELRGNVARAYVGLKKPELAWIRDMTNLVGLDAIEVRTAEGRAFVSARLEWATEITETRFFSEMNKLPQAKTNLLA